MPTEWGKRSPTCVRRNGLAIGMNGLGVEPRRGVEPGRCCPPGISFRATKAPDCTFVTSFAGMGEDDGDSKSGGVGGTIGEDNMGTGVNGNDSVVGE